MNSSQQSYSNIISTNKAFALKETSVSDLQRAYHALCEWKHLASAYHLLSELSVMCLRDACLASALDVNLVLNRL